MYRLPPDVDLSFLVNKTLIQVCFGGNDLVLNFAPNVSITVTSSVRVSGPSGTGERREDFREIANSLFRLLNSSISSAAGHPDGTLILTFTGEWLLEIYDDSDRYESYVIRYDGKTIVV